MASSQRPSGQLQVDDSRWVVVYPAYLNADYSFAKGRKIPKAAAVAAPTVGDLFAAARRLGVSVGLEDKVHPRDFFNRGRIRVQLWNTRVTPKVPIHPQLRCRRDLYVAIAAAIPHIREVRAKLEGAKPTGGKPTKAPAAAGGASAGGGGGGSSSAGSGAKGNKKKGGKKGKAKR
ncbi:hypothetical protein BU14_0060s0003 [Porphyra umbilicalis]|uniref:Signal recognition particle 19 kDa protein n=1 Tax=Porphyra umbilicalis TaxID=2786 RepID=A0A1X6PGZ4_PORUM|nr:hypothetical protein BU14_0060s0003 [Porphyra umbilicalis]|eukprot:OSX80036.1 hypothetical protein BU14_0060s0003 [Porphyra umbilicalis]